MNILFFLLILVLFGIGILWLDHLIRKSFIVSFLLFGIAPLVLTPLWIQMDYQHTWFDWAKLFSLISLTFCITLARYRTATHERAVLFFLVYVIELVNIAEALFTTLLTHSEFYFIMISAFLLILTLPSHNYMEISQTGKTPNFKWNIPMGWIIGHTVWDLSFAYAVVPSIFALLLPVFIAPLYIAAIDDKLWAQTRAVTFTLCLMGYFTSQTFFPNASLYTIFDSGSWHHPLLAHSFSVLSTIWVAGYSFIWLSREKSYD